MAANFVFIYFFLITSYNCCIELLYTVNLSSRETSISHSKCPYMTGVHPHITGSLTWEIYENVLRKCPLITGCPLIGVSLKDSIYCIEGVLSLECPLKTGFTV